jgi:hypothetical protein
MVHELPARRSSRSISSEIMTPGIRARGHEIRQLEPRAFDLAECRGERIAPTTPGAKHVEIERAERHLLPQQGRDPCASHCLLTGLVGHAGELQNPRRGRERCDEARADQQVRTDIDDLATPGVCDRSLRTITVRSGSGSVTWSCDSQRTRASATRPIAAAPPSTIDGGV